MHLLADIHNQIMVLCISSQSRCVRKMNLLHGREYLSTRSVNMYTVDCLSPVSVMLYAVFIFVTLKVLIFLAV